MPVRPEGEADSALRRAGRMATTGQTLARVVAFISVFPAAAMAQSGGVPAARVDVRLIVDGVTIEPSVVAEAKAEVTRIFLAEGVGMAWNGAGEMDAESASHYIERSLVILVRRNAARFPAPDDALGGAYGQGPARGRLAMIFFQRVQATAMKYFDYHVSLGRIFGLAIAHEIGHMLLPAGHSNTGLMKAAWGASEFLLAGRGKLMLSAAEGQVIRERLWEDNPHGFK